MDTLCREHVKDDKPNIIYWYAGFLADLWKYSTTEGNWTDITPTFSRATPPARAFHGFAASRGRLYVFGGKDDKDFLGDLRCWDPSNEQWNDLSSQTGGDTPPRPRALHAFVGHQNLIFVFGGWGSSG